MVDKDRSSFALCFTALALSTVMLVMGLIDGDMWVKGMTWLVAIYVIGQPVAISGKTAITGMVNAKVDKIQAEARAVAK